MDLVNGLFGATGCNPDGSIGQNAFTSVADQAIESHFFGMDTSVPFYLSIQFIEGEPFHQHSAPPNQVCY